MTALIYHTKLNRLALTACVAVLLSGLALNSPLIYAQESNSAEQTQQTSLPPLRSLGDDLNQDLVRQLTNPSKAAVSLIAFDCGRVLISDLVVFNKLMAGESRLLSSPCFYIEHPKKGGLIWDAGLSDALAESSPQKIFDGTMELRVENTLREQMSQVNIDPEGVEKMAISHLHFDHTGNMNAFTNAQWLIQEEELELAFSEGAAQAGFTPTDYNTIEKDRTLPLNGHHDVFGDGSVIILSAPGHTVGHQMLLVKLKETGPVLLSGDLYHFKENKEDYVIPSFNYDKRISVNSFAFADKVIEATGAQLWLQHDGDFYSSLKLSPYRYR